MSISLCRRRIRRRPSSRPSSGMLYGQCLLQVVHKYPLLGCCRALQHAPAVDFRSQAHIS